MVNPTNPNAATQSRSVQEAAQRLGVQVHVLKASTPADFNPLFAKLHDLQVAALIISQDVLFGNAVEQLGKLSVQYKIPSIYLQREFAAAEGLISYGTDLHDAYRQAGNYAGRILKGEWPSDLPVMQAAKFNLVINLKQRNHLALICRFRRYWHVRDIARSPSRVRYRELNGRDANIDLVTPGVSTSRFSNKLAS